jgi:hypothetical protein
MLFSRLKPDDIARPNFLDGAAPWPHPANAGCNDQRLPERTRMPGGSRAGLESNVRTTTSRRISRLE